MLWTYWLIDRDVVLKSYKTVPSSVSYAVELLVFFCVD